jgi:DNA-binding PucR family transcriptional regulator
MSANQDAKTERRRGAREARTAPLDALSDAVESGAGLPAIARAASGALGASVALIDRSSAVLAVAAASSAEEQKLLSRAEGVESVELRVADEVVGELRHRARGGKQPDATAARIVFTLLALELERSRAPEWESDRLTGDFVAAVLAREVTDRDDIIARAAEHGASLDDGAGVVIARAMPHSPQAGDWRERVLTLTTRALRSSSRGCLVVQREGEWAEVAAIVPCGGEEELGKVASVLERELSASHSGFAVAVARSRWTADPVDLYRAGKEALLAANVGDAESRSTTAFEDTGAYRLLLPAMSEDPGELERFFEETVAPLVGYDDQYETELLLTVEAFLDNDGNVTPTAERLFTHRHTIRYRLERVRELSGHDIFSTEGREKLGLGLKAMRVLGIASPRGPATEPGTEAGQVPRPNED